MTAAAVYWHAPSSHTAERDMVDKGRRTLYRVPEGVVLVARTLVGGGSLADTSISLPIRS